MDKLTFMARTGRAAGTAVLLATCVLQSALAYDSAKLEAALDSLNAATFTTQNPSLSLRWFLKAARQGDADAKFNLWPHLWQATGSV